MNSNASASKLSPNALIMDDSRTVVLWSGIADYELLLVRLAMAYKKFRKMYGYPMDYFCETPNYQKTLWNTNTPKVFELLVNNMGWQYILQLDKEVFKERFDTEGLTSMDREVYEHFIYGNIDKSFRLTDESLSFEAMVNLKARLPVNIKRIALKATEAWRRFIGTAPAPICKSLPLMTLNSSCDRISAELIMNPLDDCSFIVIDSISCANDIDIDLNKYANFMSTTDTTPTDLLYDAIIDSYLRRELGARPHLRNGRSGNFSILPEPELSNEYSTLPRLFNIISYTPVF